MVTDAAGPPCVTRRNYAISAQRVTTPVLPSSISCLFPGTCEQSMHSTQPWHRARVQVDSGIDTYRHVWSSWTQCNLISLRVPNSAVQM